ncbi:hypothetical protein QDG88_14060 [Pseudoalteromonas piscicida]|uniref:hypothetical protein n=1 Tax=Pseudoalteromonas piscicida TaxID=43662 RepID=UPI00273984BB|nr:hypothetical protein [Pseudoalteromonas piscicida]MDP4489044.1 hypothetical protein [Pseudoalteromonas piscicida]
MTIKKVCLGLLGLFMVSFAVVMTILFLNDYSLIVLSEDVAEFFKTFQVVFTSIAILFALIYWVLAFINDGFTEYRLHDIAGVIGSAMFMAAFLGMIWSVDLSYLFILGGGFCLYCVLIPLVTSFSGKFSNEKWEPALIWAVIFSVSIYGMSTFSNIIINEIFGVDSVYFSQTKPIAMLLTATPVTALISFSCLLFTILPFFTKSKKFDFYTANGFFASYAILVLSLAYGGNIAGVLEKTAVMVDFNSNHPCKVDDDIKGVIFLDPALKNVLVYNPSAEKKYIVQPCNANYNPLSEDTDREVEGG